MSNGQLPKRFRPGQALFQEGDSPKCIYLIQSGTVVIRKLKGAQYIELARLSANEVVGEMGFFDREPRSAGAFALTEVQAVEVPFAVLDAAYKATPPYLRAIISAMTQRLRKADEAIKRLQKGPSGVKNEEAAAAPKDELDAAAALAATADFDEQPSAAGTSSEDGAVAAPTVTEEKKEEK